MFRLSLLLVVITFEVWLRNVSSIVVNCGYNFWGLTEECFVYRCYLWLYLLRFAWGMFRLSLLLVVITFEVWLRNVSSIVVNCGYNFWGMFRLSLLLVVITFEVCLRNVSSIVVTCGLRITFEVCLRNVSSIVVIVVITFEVCLRNVSSIVVTCGYNFWGLPEECFVYRC